MPRVVGEENPKGSVPKAREGDRRRRTHSAGDRESFSLGGRTIFFGGGESHFFGGGGPEVTVFFGGGEAMKPKVGFPGWKAEQMCVCVCVCVVHFFFRAFAGMMKNPLRTDFSPKTATHRLYLAKGKASGQSFYPE